MLDRQVATLSLACLALLLFPGGRADAESPELVGHYVFDDTYDDMLGMSPPVKAIGLGQKFPIEAKVSCSGTTKDTVLDLPRGTGLELPANVIPADDYTIVLVFDANTSGRILNFNKEGADADTGLYAITGSRIGFRGREGAGNGVGNFDYDRYVRLIFTRDASTKEVDCYLDRCLGGGPKLEFSFTDTNGLAIISGGLKLLKDDATEDLEGRIAEVFLYSGGLGRLLFLRGDADCNGAFNVTDAQVILNHLFAGGPILGCEDAGDVNDDGQLNLSDPIHLLNWLFRGGLQPNGPSCEPACQKDIDFTVDALDCKTPC